jgi:2-pyrone-4,6-dicarboxylate lactonase
MNLVLPTITPIRTYTDTPSDINFKFPPLACDTHVHVFGPVAKFPFDEQRKITPLEAPKEKLFALHRKYNIQRCVIVQSIVHGFDNSVVEDAIRAGEGNYLGIALVPVSVSDSDLKRLADVGFRGVRFNFMKHISGQTKVSEVIELTHRLAHFGLHLQVHFESELIHELGPILAKSSVPVVIDHMGRIDARKGFDHSDIQALIKLLEFKNFNVKVSGIDRIDSLATSEEGYVAGVNIARLLVDRYPESCLWGTDWPHPNHTHIPDDGVLIDALPKIAPKPELMEQLLVKNPQKLYRF